MEWGTFLVGLGVVLALAIVLAVIGCIQSFKAHCRKYGTIPVFWRWVSGSHHHARDPYAQMSPDRHRPVRKRRLPARLRRIIYRLSVPMAFLWYPYVWIAGSTPLWILTAVITAGLVLESLRHEHLTISARKHYRRWVKPLAEALRPEINEPMPERAGDWVFVAEPEKDEKTPKRAAVDLPRHWSGTDVKRERIIRIIKDTLEMDDSASVSWRLMSLKSHIEVIDRPPSPNHVTLRNIEAEIEKQRARDGAIIHNITLGLGRGSEPVGVSLAEDSPHIGLSIGPGGGKSQFARLVAGQVLHRGGCVLILDVKRFSHQWAKGLPNVRYAKMAEEIHEALLWLSKEVNRRTDLADLHADIEGEVEVNLGPRILVIVEEMNEMLTRLRRYWADIRDPKKDPAKSPAITALEEALYMGRQININLLGAAQMMTAQAAGSGAARECFGVRVLGRFSKNNWRMLVPEFEQPERSMHPGRVQVVTTEVRECQIAFLSGREAREYASSGDVTPFPSDKFIDSGEIDDHDTIEGEIVSEGDVPETIKVKNDKIPAIEPPGWTLTQDFEGLDDVEPERLTLRDLVEYIPGKTEEAMRIDRKRDPRFPANRGKRGKHFVYDPGEVISYYHNKRNGKNGNGK